MRVQDIEAANDETMRAVRAGRPLGLFRGFVDVAIPGCPPFVMFSNADCSVVNVILEKGRFEPGSLALWCKLARTASGVLDIGAYTGIYALAAASVRPDLTVHAFEPNPYSVARVRLNRHANALWNIEEHFCAVGHQDGVGQLRNSRKKQRGLSSTATLVWTPDLPEQALERVSIEVRTLNGPDFCETLGPRPLIKIDVEGAEESVIGGLTQLLAQKPDIIIESFSADACEAINALILPLGYAVFLIDEESGALTRRARMEKCDPRGNMNQLLTARPDISAV